MLPNIRLVYRDDGTLRAVIDGREYGIFQSSGELKFARSLSDYYWKSGRDYPIIVRNLLQDIATAYNEKFGGKNV